MNSINTKKIDYLLTEVFHLKSFRGIQKDIVHSIISGNNTLGIMPTGGGKSLTYQISGLYLTGMTLVISPLISLMEDQVNFLNSKKINAAFYNNSLNEKEKIDVMAKIKEGNLKFLFIAPERLFIHENFIDAPDFLEGILPFVNINLIVIDEAHCISSWGHDFREDYLRLATLEDKLPNVPVLSLTATADPITKQEIISLFRIKKENVFTAPIERSNLIYNVQKKCYDGFHQCLKIIEHHKNEKGIIYCFKKIDVDNLSKALKSHSIKAEPYHADLSDEKKKKVLKDFLDNKIDVVVATIAFGMGIDKSNIRFIIHKDCPKNVESYYQETGRAGRDGKTSWVWFLYAGKDFHVLNFLLNNSSQKWKEKIKLNFIKHFVETSMCRKQVQNWYFENEKGKACGKCDVCTHKFLFAKEEPKFIEFINENLYKKEVNLFNFEKLIETKFEKHKGHNWFYQLLFSNHIEYKRKENTVSLPFILDDRLEFNELLDLDEKFKTHVQTLQVKRKVISKPTSKTSTKSVVKTPSKTTTTKKTPTKVVSKKVEEKPKKTLSKEQLAKMKEGKEKAALRKKELEAKRKKSSKIRED